MAIYNILAILLLLFLPLKSSSQSTVQPNAEAKVTPNDQERLGQSCFTQCMEQHRSTGQVTALFLPSFHIAKPIPASICSLKNLTSIDLSYNNLTGDFPTVLYACSALELLDLSNNQLSGRLPDDIDKLSS
uniref:Leucine-rich repeat-containing N-terminal plant-type domain-containing protein n=1 Tax=Oryza meridionalis TaxID=40149 RepID=A0A0E0CI94_9ORYZ